VDTQAEPGLDYERLTAPWGLDCLNCPMYRANADNELRGQVAGCLQLAEHEAEFAGCRSEGGQIPCLRMQEPCSVYQCTEARGYQFCFQCPSFPCRHLQPYADRAAEVPHNLDFYNLCLIKRMGPQAWGESRALKARKAYFHELWHL
jgi:hypothetical protein